MLCFLLQCIDCIQKDAKEHLQAGSEVALLLNNLGSTPQIEMYIMAHTALKYAQDKYKVVDLACFHVSKQQIPMYTMAHTALKYAQDTYKMTDSIYFHETLKVCIMAHTALEYAQDKYKMQ